MRARQAEKLAEQRLKEVEKERQAAVAARGEAKAVSEFLAEAPKLHGETLELQRQILGPEHWETLNSMLNLATIYLDQRRLDEAEKLFKEVLPPGTPGGGC